MTKRRDVHVIATRDRDGWKVMQGHRTLSNVVLYMLGLMVTLETLGVATVALMMMNMAFKDRSYKKILDALAGLMTSYAGVFRLGVVVLAMCAFGATRMNRTPYKRAYLLLEQGAGIQVAQTGGWLQSCRRTEAIPNAYRITRPGYVLTLAHSNQPHLMPEFFIAATSTDGRALTLEGPSVSSLEFALGMPWNSLKALNVTATNAVFPYNNESALVFDVKDTVVIGHEELRYGKKLMDCVEVDGP